MHWSPFRQRFVSARLSGAAFLLLASSGSRSLQAQQTMEQTVAEEPAPAQVFEPTSAEQLSKIAHPELRMELLRMAAEDQAARSAAT